MPSADPNLTPMPAALRAAARWQPLGDARVPAMLAHPDWTSGSPAPVVLWMHGRTVSKEIDPGRYLRWLRAGIAACALDLPGHGERSRPDLQEPARTLDIVTRMAEELDGIVLALANDGRFDMERVGVGGMSAGGIAAIVRLCRPHAFTCASVESTTGSWRHQQDRAMFRHVDPATIDRLDPIGHVDGWREVPFQAIHNRHDQWVAFEGQEQFIEALRRRYADASQVEMVVYDHSGAPNEHSGFGRFSADAKDRQRDFFRRWLRA